MFENYIFLIFTKRKNLETVLYVSQQYGHYLLVCAASQIHFSERGFFSPCVETILSQLKMRFFILYFIS